MSTPALTVLNIIATKTTLLFGRTRNRNKETVTIS